VQQFVDAVPTTMTLREMIPYWRGDVPEEEIPQEVRAPLATFKLNQERASAVGPNFFVNLQNTHALTPTDLEDVLVVRTIPVQEIREEIPEEITLSTAVPISPVVPEMPDHIEKTQNFAVLAMVYLALVAWLVLVTVLWFSLLMLIVTALIASAVVLSATLISHKSEVKREPSLGFFRPASQQLEEPSPTVTLLI